MKRFFHPLPDKLSQSSAVDRRHWKCCAQDMTFGLQVYRSARKGAGPWNRSIRRCRKRSIVEAIEVAGNQLVERVKEVLAEGNVRQLRIGASDGDIYLETPLTIGVIAAQVARVSIEVERETDEEEDGDSQDSPSAPPSA